MQVSTTFSTSDVTVVTTAMRRKVTAQSVIAFVFNTVIVALVVSAMLTFALNTCVGGITGTGRSRIVRKDAAPHTHPAGDISRTVRKDQLSHPPVGHISRIVRKERGRTVGDR